MRPWKRRGSIVLSGIPSHSRWMKAGVDDVVANQRDGGTLMLCSLCGTQQAVDAAVCPRCGSGVNGSVAKPPPGPSAWNPPPPPAPLPPPLSDAYGVALRPPMSRGVLTLAMWAEFLSWIAAAFFAVSAILRVAIVPVLDDYWS